MLWDAVQAQRAVCVVAGTVARTALKPQALLPGSFNPLHEGHTRLAAVAAVRLGMPVHFELSLTNVDKPEMPQVELQRRLHQFGSTNTVWVTRSATFAEKAVLFPGSAFILGWDTAVRVADPRYYGGASARDEALQQLRELGCRLVVGGRVDTTGQFRVWDCAEAVAGFADLFLTLTEADFRVDLSSSQLRCRASESDGESAL